MDFEVRGPPQVVGRIDDTDLILHDPLLVTVLDFNRRALDQLAHGLHLTVTYTYNHAPGINKNGFFKHEGKPVNPSHSDGSKDVYCLLKNIQENAETYSDLLQEGEEEIEETSKFLRENIRNAMAHQTYLNCGESADTNDASCALRKTKTTEECLDECAKLLQWVVDAGFYRKISSKVEIILTNIKNMKDIFEDFKRVKQSMGDRDASCADTEKAKNLLSNLQAALEEEEEEEEEEAYEDMYLRPVTRLINMVLAPRLRITR